PFGQFDYDDWITSFKVNAIGPTKLVEALYPNLVKGRLRKVVCLSSQMASISAAGRDGAYSYRASKAALNGAMATLARELVDPMIHFYLFHPGWVATDMGGSEAPIKPAESVAQMRQQIEQKNPQGGALFLNYTGTELHW
ncbi:MAG TPA: short-chain dehydrogenase, partial [Gammaproteobacteria bacterium]|nr:short-chain dehydrogenase [Gammaproteobacteria bacterium]